MTTIVENKDLLEGALHIDLSHPRWENIAIGLGLALFWVTLVLSLIR